MLGDWFVILESTALASALRNSVWTYPLVNAGHILGVALLIGAIVPLDIRLLGFWESVPVAPLWRVLTRTATLGLALTLSCGVLLFICRATAYANSKLFTVKMVIVGIGIINALLLNWAAPTDLASAHQKTTRLTWRMRLSALISIVAWLTALALGRLVGYF